MGACFAVNLESSIPGGLCEERKKTFKEKHTTSVYILVLLELYTSARPCKDDEDPK